MQALEGTRIREWEIVRRIAEGGMGVVYEAAHVGIGRKAAIKVLAEEFAQEHEYVQRFGAEARALAGISHRGVVEVFDAGVLPDGRPWLAMELLTGETLHALLKRGKPPLARAIEMLDQLLSALAAAHAAGLVHRDVKPGNIFIVTRPFEAPFVKVMDFGLVHRAPGGASVPQTRQDRFVGTPGYMAPEQALARPVGPACDLYAVGAVAFELFTGQRPFEHDDPIELARLHVEAMPPRPSKLTPNLPEGIDRWVGALLEKDPARRPAEADAVRRELLGLMGGRTEENPALARRPAEATPVPLPMAISTTLQSAVPVPETLLDKPASTTVPTVPSRPPLPMPTVISPIPPSTPWGWWLVGEALLIGLIAWLTTR